MTEYFLRNKRDIRTILREKVPDHHPFTRILKVYFPDGKEERFVVKILKSEEGTADKSVSDILHEIAVQRELKKLGFAVREYLLFETTMNNPIGFPFSVATCLKGNSLNTMPLQTVSFVIPKVLDYLYDLHSKTISNSFGYSLKPKRRYTGKASIRFAEFESKYLLADIQRDNIEFNAIERKDLMRAVNLLNNARLFCLCHSDVTLSNIIWDGSNVHLIDWSYSHFSEPTFDIAYTIFWLLEFGFLDQAKEEIQRSFERYQLLGFNIVPRFLFYLVYKYIEFGRFKGVSYIKQGKQLLKEIPSKSLEDLLSSITKISKKNPLNSEGFFIPLRVFFLERLGIIEI